MVPSPIRVKVPFVGNWVSGAAMERVAEVRVLLAGRTGQGNVPRLGSRGEEVKPAVSGGPVLWMEKSA
jgi:hypothetical protein